MSVGVMKDYKLKQRDLRASHTPKILLIGKAKRRPKKNGGSRKKSGKTSRGMCSGGVFAAGMEEK